MKRVFLAIMGLIMVLVHLGGAFSEPVDFSGYDDKALLEIFEQIQSEIIKRGIKKSVTLPKGTYRCGIDFPEGGYIISMIMEEKTEGCIWVYDPSVGQDNKEYTEFYEYITHRDVAKSYIDGEKYEYKVDIDDGKELKVDFPVTITTFSPLLFQ